jgi:hypothetical protein
MGFEKARLILTSKAEKAQFLSIDFYSLSLPPPPLSRLYLSSRAKPKK